MKYVVVTGAYGGMGYKTAKTLSENGFTVFALDKKVKEPEPNVIPVETDLTDTESVKRAFLFVKSQTDELYAVVHFAGIYRLDSLVEMSEERFTGIFDINLFGAYRVNKIFFPPLNRRFYPLILGLVFRSGFISGFCGRFRENFFRYGFFRGDFRGRTEFG